MQVSAPICLEAIREASLSHLEYSVLYRDVFVLNLWVFLWQIGQRTKHV